MNIVVCIRVAPGGDIGPFDAAALEAALRFPDAEVSVVSMGPASAEESLARLTRLGLKRAFLLCDPAFAGSDTLATGYILSEALKKLSPDYIFCGRKTLVGDTGQVGAGIAARLGIPCCSGIMSIDCADGVPVITDRNGLVRKVPTNAVLVFERIYPLRAPSVFSVQKEVTVWGANELALDISRCGSNGSPTHVTESRSGSPERRRCRFIRPDEYMRVVAECLAAPVVKTEGECVSGEKLPLVVAVGTLVTDSARGIAENVIATELATAQELSRLINEKRPDAVLFDSAPASKQTAAELAVYLETGLCADAIGLTVRGGELLITRPAFAGDVIATVVSRRSPSLVTVRTAEENSSDIMISCGLGARNCLAELSALAEKMGAELTASRAAVDAGLFAYSAQVGLTGRTVTPEVYTAVGISGAAHHLAGCRNVGTIIAVNTDRNAPIFDSADFGIIATAEEFAKLQLSCANS